MTLRLMLALVTVTAVATAGACSKPSGDGLATANGTPAANQTDGPAVRQEDRVLQFVACLRGEGLEVPDPEPGDATGKTALRFVYDSGADKATVGPAMEKCAKYMPDGGEEERLTPEEIEQQRLLAQCMRDNGVPAWPDPDSEGKFKSDSSISKDDPVVQAAIEKCRNYIVRPGESEAPKS